MSESVVMKEKHPRLLRITHWLNVIFLSLMVWSGILIYWADQAFLKIPDELIEVFGINHRLAEGMGWHFFIMWPFCLNAFIYLIYLALKGAWKQKYTWAQRFAYTGAIILGTSGVLSGFCIYKPVQLGLITSLLGGYRSARFIHFVSMVGLVIFVIVHLIQVIKAGFNHFRGMVAGFEIEKP
jgi:thiosulfate reductase cytochrome b subunit